MNKYQSTSQAITAMKNLEKLVKPFNGEGDVGQWLKKLKLVAKIQKLTEVECVIPLLLEGQAFMVVIDQTRQL